MYVELDHHRDVVVQELTMLRSQPGSETIFLRFLGGGQTIAALTLHSLLQIPAWIQRSSDTSSGSLRNRDSHNKPFLQKKFVLVLATIHSNPLLQLVEQAKKFKKKMCPLAGSNNRPRHDPKADRCRGRY